MKIQHRRKRGRGYSLVETPIVLWLLFVVFVIPFVDMCAMLLRYTFMVAASRDGVHAAARAKSYLTDISGTERSAVNLANTQARATAATFSEITVDSVVTRLLVTDLDSRTTVVRTTPLITAADTDEFLYEFETVVTGRLNPLVTFNVNGLFPGIPGLSAPINVSVASKKFVENTQGLNQ